MKGLIKYPENPLAIAPLFLVFKRGGRKRNNGHFGVELTDERSAFKAIHNRHPEVHQHKVVPVRLNIS
jgi:hypothetical protein